MNAQHLQQHKQQLEALRASLLTQLAAQRDGTKSRADVAAEHFAHSEESPAQVNTERDLAFAIDEHELEELAAIDSALNRMKEGTYGLCVDCDVPIAPARLQASPEAARCIDCQEKTEHAHR